MQYAITLLGLIAGASAHCVITSIEGANGVTMPGLSIADGTPRDCSSNGCGSQADTSIIRDSEIASGEVGPLGRTQGNGPVDPNTMIAAFMNGASAPTNNGAADSTGVEDDISGLRGASRGRGQKNRRQFLGRLFGGGGGGSNANGQKNEFSVESSVAATAGDGATSGMPTCSDSGEISVTMRQINQDGAGPMEAMVDGTSGGTDMNAFQRAQVTQDVPGFVAGLSLTTTTDFPMKIQMPAGMTCDGSAGGVDNVCIVRVRNSTPAGPFGGSAAFTMPAAARKRAIAYRLKKRMEIGREE
ncbi:uncharacterized protein F5Z01DRAFT_111585 [Emericellopsis atlantica]|uniref:Cell surface protein n=1 Tax=Emericellopsis atlantica TaxID=2614577 RepID=A0A9P8CNZ1_9HYPO|nr:uncharacterized protein F5Z01DRAFT_111585 [Emericellopsis atlantica]KAG9254008.1 hypothetical protein F5Z01DRAFT_111585 [Emericellopsis atlantica]